MSPIREIFLGIPVTKHSPAPPAAASESSPHAAWLSRHFLSQKYQVFISWLFDLPPGHKYSQHQGCGLLMLLLCQERPYWAGIELVGWCLAWPEPGFDFQRCREQHSVAVLKSQVLRRGGRRIRSSHAQLNYELAWTT